MVKQKHRNRQIVIIVTICLFLFSKLSAQHFSNLYYNNRPSMMFGSIEFVNDSYYASGVTTFEISPNHYYTKALFGKINGDGTLNFEKGMYDTSNHHYSIFLNCLKKTTDGNFVATGEFIDSISTAFLIKTDTAGNILLWKVFSDSLAIIYQGMDIIETKDSGYLLAINCEYSFGNNSKVVIIKTDSLGNEFNLKKYDLSAREYPWVIRPMLNGHYMIGAFSGKTNSNTPYWAKTWMIEIDNMGNMLTQWLDTDNKNLWPRGMQQTSDSGWIIVRQHLDYDISDFQAYNASILRVDKHFNKQWEIDTGGIAQEGGMYDVEILPDGNYICAGTNPINLTQDSAHLYGWLMKISTTGQILWEHTYLADTHYGTWCFLNDIDVLPNGDLLACGELRYTHDVGITPVQQGWILRTDSNGCVLDNCTVGIEESEAETTGEMKVYPNPARDYVTFELNSTEPANIEVYDLCGRKVFEKEILSSTPVRIETVEWNSGVYFWQTSEHSTKQYSGKLVIVKW